MQLLYFAKLKDEFFILEAQKIDESTCLSFAIMMCTHLERSVLKKNQNACKSSYRNSINMQEGKL